MDGIYQREGSPYWYMLTRIKGKIHSKSTGTIKKSEAKKIRRKWAEELRKNINIPGNSKIKITCIEMFGLYQQSVHNNWKHNQHPDNTKKDFLRLVDYWVNFIGENTYMNEIILDDIIETYKNKRQDDGVKPRTINLEIGFLRQAYKRVKIRKKYFLCEEPNWTQFMSKKEKPIDRSMSDKDILIIYAAAKPHAKNVIYWRLVSGLRKFNSMQLTTEMIDWDKMQIVFKQKGNQEYILPITHEMENLLKGKKLYFSESEEDYQARLKCLNLTKPGSVFLYKGKPFKSIRRSYKTAQREGGTSKIYREHDTRHTTAHLIGNAEHVMKTYGHSDIETSRIYDQTDLIVRTESLKKIGKRVHQIVHQSHSVKKVNKKNDRKHGRGERI